MKGGNVLSRIAGSQRRKSVLFVTLIKTTLSLVISSRKLIHELNTNDTHIYISLFTSESNCSLNQLINCVNYIFFWMI